MDIHNPFLKFEYDIGLFDSSKFKYVLKTRYPLSLEINVNSMNIV